MNQCENQNPITVHRVEEKREFTIIHNHIFNSQMSLAAIGLICSLLSLPQDWVFHKNQMMSKFNIGRDSFNNLWKELKENGYVDCEIKRDKSSGKIINNTWHIFEKPNSKNVTAILKNRSAVEPECGETTTTNNSWLTKNEKNTNTACVRPRETGCALVGGVIFSEEKNTSDDEVDVASEYDRIEEDCKRDLLKEYGFKEGDLRELLKKSVIQIEKAIAAVVQFSEGKEVHSPSGLVKTAIMKGWEPKEVTLSKEEKAKRRENAEFEEKLKELENRTVQDSAMKEQMSEVVSQVEHLFTEDVKIFVHKNCVCLRDKADPNYPISIDFSEKDCLNKLNLFIINHVKKS